VTNTPGPATGGIATDAGGPAAGSFVADTDFAGGSTSGTAAAIDTSGVANPAPQAVYQTSRYGSFSYTVPNLTPGGGYQVRLHFAETWWGAQAPGGAGSRLFNVAINGSQVLGNFDIYAAAGGANKAVARQFAAVADASGQITVAYTTVVDNALASGIEVFPTVVGTATPTATTSTTTVTSTVTSTSTSTATSTATATPTATKGP
jgi:hypothetical protein